MRDIICLVLVTILFGCSTLEAGVGTSARGSLGQTESKAKPTLKERILEVPPGSMIEVRLHNKEKFRGRLGEITDEGLSLQTAQGNKIESQKIAFADMKSFKKVESAKAAKTFGWVAIGVLAGVGALVIILVAVLAASQG